jgi:hypothetical protein
MEGALLGWMLILGLFEGAVLGAILLLGSWEGMIVGASEGILRGGRDGICESDGSEDGTMLGSWEGRELGSALGARVGPTDAWMSANCGNERGLLRWRPARLFTHGGKCSG